jgi:hypothetical protein
MQINPVVDQNARGDEDQTIDYRLVSWDSRVRLLGSELEFNLGHPLYPIRHALMQ